MHGTHVELFHRGAFQRRPLIALPERYLDWMERGRRSTYETLRRGGGTVSFASHHLPVLVTSSDESDAPFNCSNKGVGFLPKSECLEHYTALFRSVLAKTAGRPWRESMDERITAVSAFYLNREAIDARCLTTLEIFEKNTYRNLRRDPVATLHYTGSAPDYLSFQVDGAVELVEPGDPRHEFIRLARLMFEFDDFHIAQSEFPHAYVFWVTGVKDKTPFRVPERHPPTVRAPSGDGLVWEAEAVDAVNRAPGMIREFITEQVEAYARRRGFGRVDLSLVREARAVMERPASDTSARTARRPEDAATTSTDLSRYASVYVGLDSSPLADAATRLAVQIGERFGSIMYGSHVYAARMHDNRFRAMESGLPARYRRDEELEKQRRVHDSLITKGLELITDSYLEGMSRTCADAGLPYTPVSLEGKNWQRLVEDIATHDYELVAMGAFGIGRVGRSQLGSVVERTLRRARRDFLIVKRPESENVGDAIVLCLDGSERSWGGLYRGMALARAFDKRLIAIAAFDPYFHYAMFKSLNKALTDDARKVFRFEEQEKLHEDIIDSGLAKIYQGHLNIAARLAEAHGTTLETKLLDGKPFEKILEFADRVNPWLLIAGRTGFHSEEGMDLGSNTENLARQCACNLLVVESKAKPPAMYQAEETVAWTDQAQSRLSRVPAMALPLAMQAIQDYCLAEGHTVVTESVLDEALRSILPAEMLARMGIDPTAKERTDRSIAARQVADGEAQTALGDRQLVWETPALAVLNSITDPFGRDHVRNRVEKRALTQKTAVVTEAMVRLAMPAS